MLLTVVVAALFPAKGVFADVMDWVVIAAIALLFFLYGAWLLPRGPSTASPTGGCTLLILAFTFVVFLIIGRRDAPLSSNPRRRNFTSGACLHLPGALDGQSSIAFTLDRARKRGWAIVAASVSSLIGVIVTPLLAVWLMNTSSGHAHRRLLGPADHGADPAAVPRRATRTAVDRRLGRQVREADEARGPRFHRARRLRGLLRRHAQPHLVPGQRREVIAVAAPATALVVVMLIVTGALPPCPGSTAQTPSRSIPADRKKSLAAGLPMATVLFTGSTVGLICPTADDLHQIQLIPLQHAGSSRYAKRPDPEVNESSASEGIAPSEAELIDRLACLTLTQSRLGDSPGDRVGLNLPLSSVAVVSYQLPSLAVTSMIGAPGAPANWPSVRL